MSQNSIEFIFMLPSAIILSFLRNQDHCPGIVAGYTHGNGLSEQKV